MMVYSRCFCYTVYIILAQSVMRIPFSTFVSAARPNRRYEVPSMPEPLLKNIEPIGSKVETIDRIEACPDYYTLQDNQCIQKMIALPNFKCRKSYHIDFNHNTMCAKRVKKNVTCSNGFFSHEENLCIQEERTSYELHCPPDFTFESEASNDTCIRITELPPIAYCPENMKQKGNVCLEKIPKRHQLKCPLSYQLRNDHCVRETEYDCTKDNNTVSNNSELSTQKLNPITGYLRSNAGNFPTNRDNFSPIVIEEEVIRKLCKKTILEKPKLECINSTFVDNECVHYVQKPLQFKPGGYQLEKETPIKVCPLGYTLNEDDYCLHEIKTSLESYCPENAEAVEDYCVFYDEPTKQCPIDYTLVNNLCERTIYAEPIIEYYIRVTCDTNNC